MRFFRSFLLFWSTIDLVQYRNRGFSIRSRPPPPPLEPPIVCERGMGHVAGHLLWVRNRKVYDMPDKPHT